MHVILIRHAHAEDGENDAARPLSRKGVRQARALGRLLRDAEAFEAEEVWHSPLVRARQTAVLLAKRLDTEAPLREVGGLRPSDDPAATARRVGDARQPLAIVGHDPHLSELATLLVTGKAAPLRFKLKKGAALRLDRVAGGWVVRWLVTPDLAG